MIEPVFYRPFERKIPAVTANPRDDDKITVCFNYEWRAPVLGALASLLDTNLWEGSDIDIELAEIHSHILFDMFESADPCINTEAPDWNFQIVYTDNCTTNQSIYPLPGSNYIVNSGIAEFVDDSFASTVHFEGRSPGTGSAVVGGEFVQMKLLLYPQEYPAFASTWYECPDVPHIHNYPDTNIDITGDPIPELYNKIDITFTGLLVFVFIWRNNWLCGPV